MIKVDSRKIKKGDIFLDLSNNEVYVKDAIKNGAKGVIVKEGIYEVETKCVENPRQYYINYLKRYYYKKIKDIKLIGITGTNGKTTTCYLIYQALNKLNKKCAYIGTIGFYLNNKKEELQNTTPDIGELYEMLIRCKNENVEYVVMEVSSQALDMNRVDSLLFDFVIFTNLTQDHLDYHKTMENYVKCKQKLFKMGKNTCKYIVNIDDKYKQYFFNKNSITYGFNISDYSLNLIKQDFVKTIFSVNNIIYETSLLGKYNLYNLCVCILILKELRISNEKIKEIIFNLQAPPGRMERIFYLENQIIIDYAHTPDAVFNILNTMKELPVNNIITIIGCGGVRDKTQRPIMGAIATMYSSNVIFTSDNPRGEDPNIILKEMTSHLTKTNYEIIVNREIAIKKGIQSLSKNDILLVLGKGHENYQIIKNEKLYFSDLETVLKIIGR